MSVHSYALFAWIHFFCFSWERTHLSPACSACMSGKGSEGMGVWGSEGGTRTYPQRMADRHHRRLLRKSLTMLTQLLLPTLMWMTSLPLPQLPPPLLPRARCSPTVWPLSLQLSSQWASLPASLLARGRPRRRCCWRWLPCSADSLLLLSLSPCFSGSSLSLWFVVVFFAARYSINVGLIRRQMSLALRKC